MRIVLAGLTALTLAGCATGPTPPPTGSGILSPLVTSGVISAETRAKAQQVQATTKALCGYIPTLVTLASIFSAGAGGGIATIASGLCDAVTTAPLADGGRRNAYYYGVKLQGTLKGKRI